MAEETPFRLVLSGGSADDNYFQGYEGFNSLAGFAWTLSLASNFVETGQVRHRGDFPGRHSVRAYTPRPGSIIADFGVWLTANPALATGLTLAASVPVSIAANLLTDVVKHVIKRNLGQDDEEDGPLKAIADQRSGDLEALVAATEPSIRQNHQVIGNGAHNINIYGGKNYINTYDAETKRYVSQNVEDETVMQKDFSVAAFNANSGHGSVFDSDIGRTVPFSMKRDQLREYGSAFGWGLNEYANRTGQKIRVTYWRILALDGRPKKYVVLRASIPSRNSEEDDEADF